MPLCVFLRVNVIMFNALIFKVIVREDICSWTNDCKTYPSSASRRSLIFSLLKSKILEKTFDSRKMPIEFSHCLQCRLYQFDSFRKTTKDSSHPCENFYFATENTQQDCSRQWYGVKIADNDVIVYPLYWSFPKTRHFRLK
jgi:hypothetical protein